ncbi:MAG TPA: LysE family translocator [bacterium]|nr:LysE family translocator [bacterium]HMW33615.1 LysE family translocator [bacterium]HMW37576.1 LysE family translocator [bacterium]HMY36858.1 LysE family translocator [bacterium]HMZ05599.1 LysE family translocator [bacterium]
MDYTLFSIFFVTTFLMALSPGPAVFLIMSQGMKFGVRGSMLGALGIEVMNALYFFISALGLSAALLAFPVIFQVLKWSGIGYLIFMGIKILITAKPRPMQTVQVEADKKLFSQGIITQAANPKAVIYFGSMLPQFIAPDKSIALQFTVLAVVGCVMEFIILSAYGWIAHKGAQFLPGPQAVLWQDRIAGICLLTVALVLITK